MEKESERVQRLFEAENFEDKIEEAGNKDDLLTDNFDTYSEPFVDFTCNVVSVLPREYEQIIEVEELEENINAEMANHRPVCYYVMNNGCVSFFERPDEAMKIHMKPFFVRGKFEKYVHQQDSS